MPTVQEQIRIDAAPEEVWSLAGDPGRIADWLPALESSRVEQDRRSCTLVEGGRIEERILQHSDDERRYRYEVLEGPMPLSSYVSSLEVADHDGHAHVTWTAEFEPEHPAQEQELVQTFEQIYSGGLQSLKDRLESAR